MLLCRDRYHKGSNCSSNQLLGILSATSISPSHDALVRLADSQNLFQRLDPLVKDRLFLYADDVILFTAARQQDPVLTRGILEMFAADAGLHTNVDKCLIAPIQCNLESTVTLMSHFPAKLSPLPIKYLGIPLSVGKLRKSDLQPLVDKVADALPIWKAKFSTKAGRAVLVKAKLSAIPVHTAMAVTLSPWAIKCIDTRRRAFLWTGTDKVAGGKCSLAWPGVCRPAELGGLGVMDLQLFGYALRMRWLWFRKTDASRPWANLPDSTEKVVADLFHASVSMEIGNGERTLFWSDRWLQGKCIQELAPCLFNTVGPRVSKRRTVAQALTNDSWVRDIAGALTVQVILDFLLIWEATRGVQLQPDTQDKFLWKWTPDKCFTTASAYHAFFIGQTEIAGARCLMKARAPGKCKFFVWLVLHGRCWTAERRKRHNLQDDDTCALCSQQSESITHLLLNCPFAKECWFLVLHRMHWLMAEPRSR